ncbi:Uncharacterised protein [Vibrio cholerae]|nr:Uncharacterised protein [Vibrio cholerae]
MAFTSIFTKASELFCASFSKANSLSLKPRSFIICCSAMVCPSGLGFWPYCRTRSQ